MADNDLSSAISRYREAQRQRNLDRVNRLKQEQGSYSVSDGRLSRSTGGNSGSSGGSSSSGLNYTPAPEEQLFTPVDSGRRTTQTITASPSGKILSRTVGGVEIPQEQQVRVRKSRSGNVVGIEDPLALQSQAVGEGVTEADIRAAEQQRFSELVSVPDRTRRGFTRGGVFGAASKNEKDNLDQATKEAIARQEKLNRQLETPVVRQLVLGTESFKQGFTFGRDKDIPDAYASLNTQNKGQFDELATGIGTYAGAYGSAAVSTKAFLLGGQATRATTQTITPIFQTGSQLVNVPANILGNAAITAGWVAGSEAIYKGKEKLVKPERELKLTKKEKEAFNAARIYEQTSFSRLGQAGFQLGTTGNLREFRKEAKRELEAAGYSGARLNAALEKLEIERGARQNSALIGNLVSGAFSEFTGQTQLDAAQRAGKKLNFGTFFTGIAPAGAGEGFSQTVISQRTVGDTRNFFTGKTTRSLFDFNPIPVPQSISSTQGYKELRQKTSFTTTPFQEALVGATGGYLVSGLLGGYIGDRQLKGQTGRANIGKTLGYGLDPSEFPSDILSSGITSVGRKSGRGAVITGVPAFASVPSNVQTNVQSSTTVQALIGTPANTNIPTTLEGLVSARVKPSTNINPFADIPADVTPFSDTPVNTDTNTPVNTETPVSILTDTPVDVNTNINTFVDVPTPVFIDRTGVIGAIPPLPFGFNFGGGGFGGRGGKARVKFVDELTASTNIFRQQLGFKPVRAVKKSKKSTLRKTAGRKKAARRNPPKKRGNSTPRQRAASPSINNFNKLVFGF